MGSDNFEVVEVIRCYFTFLILRRNEGTMVVLHSLKYIFVSYQVELSQID